MRISQHAGACRQATRPPLAAARTTLPLPLLRHHQHHRRTALSLLRALPDDAAPSSEPRQRVLPPPSDAGGDSSSRDGQQRQRRGGGGGPLFAWVRQWWAAAQRAAPLGPSAKRALAYVRVALLGLAAALLMSLLRAAAAARARTAPREVLYSDFVALVDASRVRAARLEAGSGKLYFDLRLPSQQQQQQQQKQAGKKSAPPPASAATAPVPLAQSRPALSRHCFVKVPDGRGGADLALVSRLLAAGVEFGVTRPGPGAQLANVAVTTLALWLSLAPLLFVLRRVIDARSGSGSARRKTASSASSAGGAPPITFADVAGCDAAKLELWEVVQCLKDAARYSRVRARMPSGVLLSGPPGTGKTLLAKAVAGEAGVPFLATSASEFVELFVGRGAARVRELFADARRLAPCVVFIDELDALGSKRGAGFNDERDQTLNQLLTELDGFEGRPGVVLLAATNRPDVLDAALLRPGRLSRKVVVPLPDEAGRRAILKVHLRGVPLEGAGEVAAAEAAAAADAAADARASSSNGSSSSSSSSSNGFTSSPSSSSSSSNIAVLTAEEAAARIAAVTPSFSGAELGNVVNEASLLAARAGKHEVGMLELLEGVRRQRFGVDGRGTGGVGGGPMADLRQRFGKWLLENASGRPVKVASA